MCRYVCAFACAYPKVTVEKERGTNILHVVRQRETMVRKSDTHNKPNERETNIFLKSALRSLTPTDSVADPFEKLLTKTSYMKRRM